MPYINQSQRTELEEAGLARVAAIVDTRGAGALAYVVYRLLCECTRNTSFQRLATMCGAVSLGMSEFTRRVVVPYELTKLDENGDVKL